MHYCDDLAASSPQLVSFSFPKLGEGSFRLSLRWYQSCLCGEARQLHTGIWLCRFGVGGAEWELTHHTRSAGPEGPMCLFSPLPCTDPNPHKYLPWHGVCWGAQQGCAPMGSGASKGHPPQQGIGGCTGTSSGSQKSSNHAEGTALWKQYRNELLCPCSQPVPVPRFWSLGTGTAPLQPQQLQTDSNSLHLHSKFPAPSVQGIWSFHEWRLKLDLRKVHL